MEVILVLHNIRSCYNVGAIIRTAEGMGLDEIWLSGWTPNWKDEKELPHIREKIRKQIEKTALGAENMMRVRGDLGKNEKMLVEALKEKRQEGWKLVGLENNLVDKRLMRLGEVKMKEKIGEKVILVLGEEVEGINEDLRKILDVMIEIPMKGKKESFNVSVACGIGLWEIMKNNLFN